MVGLHDSGLRHAQSMRSTRLNDESISIHSHFATPRGTEWDMYE